MQHAAFISIMAPQLPRIWDFSGKFSRKAYTIAFFLPRTIGDELRRFCEAGKVYEYTSRRPLDPSSWGPNVWKSRNLLEYPS